MDLAANVKLTSEPFFKKYPYIPVFALGMQDVSGGASFFKTKYAVISEEIWRLRVSAGYGTGPDRMKGVFAGGEFKAHDWFYLLADYDTRETNVGARVVLPHFWKVPISFTATAKSSIDHKPGNIDIGVGFSLPLDFKVKTAEPVQSSEFEVQSAPPNPEPVINPEPRTTNVEPAVNHEPRTTNPKPSSLKTLRDRLVKVGFMNVRVGDLAGNTAVIEFENVTFNHNEMDALGVVAGMAVEELKGDFETLRIIIKKKNIRMMQIAAPIKAVVDFLENGRIERLKSQLAISNNVGSDIEVSFVDGDHNSSFLSTSLVLWPGLSTRVGTDYGAFDYVLSLKPEIFTNLWAGGMINARWDIPLLWSDNFGDGKPYRNDRTPGRMERLMLFQGIKLLPDVMVNLGAGVLLHGINGTMNELVWQPGTGDHRVRFVQLWGRNDKAHTDMESFLASYRYYFSPLDLSLEGAVGKFISQDRGYSLELKRFFGDTAFSVYYKNSTIPNNLKRWDANEKHWQAAGVQFAFPLTLEKDMKHYYKMQLRGTDEWAYAQETTIASGNSDNANYLPPAPLAVPPTFTGSLYDQYLNRDRLNESYIKAHLERLRDAWIRYRERL
jgi:hypothetical protein